MIARIVVLAWLVAVLASEQVMAQAPAPSPDRREPDVTISPPALQRFQIQQDTPAEREALLKRQAAQQRGNKPEEVAPLPAQQITPLVSQPQR